MRDFNDFNKTIKTLAIEAVEARKPVNLKYGKVTSISPLRIFVDQKLTLASAQIILTRNVTDYKTDITVNGTKMEHIIHNKLKVGEKVLLIREQEGQKYVVTDRVM